VGLVLDQNTRDLHAKRYGLIEEVVSWFKALALFREAEFDRMIERTPTPTDQRYHKTWLAALIAEGERSLTEIRGAGGLPRNKAGIKPSDVAATVEELYDTQAEWYGGLRRESKARLLREIFDVPKS